MSVFTLKVNGRTHSVDVDPATPLLYVLSDDLELRGPKFGCGLAQCGFCVNGVIMTAKALVDRTPNPTDAQIRQAMSTVLCRCFGHRRMFQAIRRYVQTGTPRRTA
jgi:nicotinate dehydrogenase subunit A